jgi:hypothetical protein
LNGFVVFQTLTIIEFTALSTKAPSKVFLRPLTIPNNKVNNRIAKATVKPDITERNLFLLML